MADRPQLKKKKSHWRNYVFLFPVLIIALVLSIARWIQWRNELPPLHLLPHPMPVNNAFDIFNEASKNIIDAKSIKYAIRSKYYFSGGYDRKYTVAEKKHLVQENEEAIHTLRSSFDLPYINPPDQILASEHLNLTNYHSMAELLELKSKLLQMENQWYDAAQCNLDTLEMGAMCPHGGGISPGLTGNTLTEYGAHGFSKIIDHLNSDETTLILHRFERIRRKRQAFSVSIEEEKWRSLRIAYVLLSNQDIVKLRPGYSMIIMYWGKRRIIQNITQYFDECLVLYKNPECVKPNESYLLCFFM